MSEWECGEGGGLLLECHRREYRAPLSGSEWSQCQGAKGGLVMYAWSSGVSGRLVAKSLRQEEVRMEGEQHQRAHTDSDRHSAYIPLQREKKRKRFQLSQLCKSEVKLHCFCSVVTLTFLLGC